MDVFFISEVILAWQTEEVIPFFSLRVAHDGSECNLHMLG